MKSKNTDTLTKSNLPLKMIILAYINNHQNAQLISDCHNAINDRIQQLSSLIEQNFDQISSIVEQDDKKKHRSKQSLNMMEVIQQQDYGVSERSNVEDEGFFQQNKNGLIKKFNHLIGLLQKSSNKFQDIMFMYKNEIKSIAKDLTKEKQLNLKLTKQLQQKTHMKQLKQPLSNSVNQIMNKKYPQTSSFVRQPSSTKNIKNKKTPKQHESQDEQVRSPPKPFCQECIAREKKETLKQKQQIQQKNKWRQLSTKITNLKDQLSRYEEQLITKQSEINKLNQQLRKRSQDETKTQNQQKKKLRTMNTTLRGEKIVFQNQLQSLRKKFEQNSQYSQSLKNENNKLKMQKQNLQSTVKWHSNTIQDLRKNFSTGIKQQGQLLNKYNQSQQTNKVLYEQIANQQKYLEQFSQNLKQIEESHTVQIQNSISRVKQLQSIIEQKNQTILKLKIGKEQHQHYLQNDQFPPQQKSSALKEAFLPKRDNVLSGMILNKILKKDAFSLSSASHGNENFQQNMIKVLNKKLVNKECEIEKLRRQNDVLRAELDVYKQCE